MGKVKASIDWQQKRINELELYCCEQEQKHGNMEQKLRDRICDLESVNKADRLIIRELIEKYEPHRAWWLEENNE